MHWLVILGSIYVPYYTVRYAVLIWRENNRFGSVFVGLLALTITGLAIYVTARGII